MGEAALRKYYGKNYDKVMTGIREERKKLRASFVEKYPNADMTKFSFDVTFNKDATLNSSDVYFKTGDSTSYDIESNTFKSNKKWTWYLYQWKRLWNVKGTVQPLEKNSGGTDHKINSFKTYVTADDYFTANLSEFDISNDESSNDYKSNTYITALLAAYITTYACGICTEHFEYDSGTPKIITSIARYHLYYHMSRFIRDPTKMSRYVTKDMLALVMKNKPVKKVWEDKFHQGSANIFTWLRTQDESTITDYRYAFNDSGVVAGIRYKKLVKTTIVGLDDYKNFIAVKSNGLTKVGQKLLQQSAESYIYCVLGAQARTRWPIVGQGAKSLQTQDVFLKIVKDTIIQDDVTVTITNMRTAISDTNVVLNMAISPGIVLIPSNMIILKKMIAGFNNVLTLAGGGMTFGENDKVNYYGVTSETEKGTEGTADADQVENTADQVENTESITVPKKKATHSDLHESLSGDTNVFTQRSNPTELHLLAVMIIGGTLISRFII